MNNYEYETNLFKEGYLNIAGIDEVGRGPWAGPVVATAIIMPKDCYIEGVTDSKKLSYKKREELKIKIEEKALAIATVFVNEKTIDEINIYEATKVAMIKAIDSLEIKPDYILIDAMKLDVEIPTLSIIKGDEKSFTIGCASIIAKVTRDHFMEAYDEIYPEYHFGQHKGYGTKQHQQAIDQYGVLDIHRKTYKPIAMALKKQKVE